jgi:hypothetical protein
MAGLPLPLEVLRDPVVQAAGAVLVALVFATAALHKLRARDAFVGSLAAYRLLSQRALVPAAWALIGLELAVAGGVIATPTRAAGMLGACALLALYAGAMAANLLRGRRDIDCGCGGDAQRLAWPLVVRNAALAALALAWSLPAIERPIETFDYVAGLAVSLGFWGLYRVADELIRQAGRLGSLRATGEAGE